jgi:hypothetical protein
MNDTANHYQTITYQQQCPQSEEVISYIIDI